MPHDKLTLEELTRERDRLKQALDQAQRAVNERLLAESPVRRGDIIQDESGNLFRISSVCVKTTWDEHGKMTDRLVFELQKRHTAGTVESWQKARFNTTDLASRVLSGRVKMIRRAWV